MSTRLLVLLAALLPAAMPAQAPLFLEQTGLLDNTDIPSPPFSSAGPIGVVDLNGDRRDDIIRIHDGEQIRIEFQAGTGAAFTHLNLGNLATRWGWSICAADVDHNGINDFVIGELRSGHDLYIANALGTAFVPGAIPDRVDITQDTLFADLDQDGMVDLFACDDIDDLHKYRNTGNGVFVFDDSLVATQLTSAVSDDNEGNYALIGTDYDNDGDVDYYLSKCRIRDGDNTSLGRINRLFQNDGSGSYEDVAAAAGLADGAQTWCADFADIDNDGDLDCLVLNHQDTTYPSAGSRLYENDGSGSFTEITAAAGLDGQINFLGLQACFRDFNNDGWLDLIVTSMGVTEADPTYGYYQNDGDGTFTRLDDVMKHADAATRITSLHSCAIGDLNHDGFLDLYAGRGTGINQATNRADLLLFNQGNDNNFFALTLVGGRSNINGIGARIEAHGPWGVQVREIRGGEGYGIMNSLNAHFGLGAATSIDRLKVRWPSGVVDEIESAAGNRFATLHEGTGRLALSFADWIGDHLPDGGPEVAPDADPDHDRIPNLVEHVLGSDPTMPGGMPAITTVSVMEDDIPYFEIRVDRQPVQDVVIRIEFSTDGQAWTPADPAEIVAETPTVLVARRQIDGPPQAVTLARLRVSLP